MVIAAAATLSRLEVAAGARPALATGAMLAPGYSTRQQATVERAARLLAACDAALLDDGASISSFEADRRAAGAAPGTRQGGRGARFGRQLAALSDRAI